jgi:hypothetical protein
VTVGWSWAVTVITGRWWFNCKMDGAGALLHDLRADDPFAENLAEQHPDVARDLFAVAEDDTNGGFQEWVIDLARERADAPGSSELLVRD